MPQRTMNTTRSTYKKILNMKGAPQMPQMAAPQAMLPPPTIDNSEEVKKQRALEEQRAIRSKGLGSTNLTEDPVSIADENIETPTAKKKTLLGE